MTTDERILDYLEKLWHVESDRAMARLLLRETADLAAFPTDLLMHYVSLAPPLYDAGRRQFQFQRSPNKYPSGQIVFAGAGVVNIKNAVGVGGLVALDLAPVDQTSWKVLGGIISSSAAVQIQVRQEQGTKSITTLAPPINTPTPFGIPGNGVQLDSSKTVEIAVSGAATIVFQLFVAEESDTVARGAV